MKKKTRKRVISVTAILLAAVLLATPALAKRGTELIEAGYRDIKIIVDGQELEPTDEQGNTVEPFLVDDSTYLPIRAVSEALGYDVSWDSAEDSVYIDTDSDGSEDSPNVATARTLLTAEKADLADYFSDDAVYHINSSQSEAGLGEQRDLVPVDDWLDTLADDFAFFNPYTVDYIFTRVEIENGDSYTEATGHNTADQGYTDDYLETGNDIAETIVVKLGATFTGEDGTEQTEYYCIFLSFDSAGKISVINQIEDTSAESRWLDEYNAGTYAANVGGTVYTGANQDVYDSLYSDPETLLSVNLSTVGKWWGAVGEYRGYLRYLLATEDATKSVTELFYNEDLFAYGDHTDETYLYYTNSYETGTLAGNRVHEVTSDGWLYGILDDEDGDPYIQFALWGWYTDNRIYTCVDDPNVILSDSEVSAYDDRMLVSLTMRDGQRQRGLGVR